MTKIYSGGGEYDIALCTGMKLQLNEEELKDLQDGTVQEEDYLIQSSGIEESSNRISIILNDFEVLYEDTELLENEELKSIRQKIFQLEHYLSNVRCQNKY